MNRSESADVRGVVLAGAQGTRGSGHRMPFGAEIDPGGEVRFRVFAPSASSMSLAIEGRPESLAMEAEEGGWFELRTSAVAEGARYRYVFPDGASLPDPVSRFQPEDVHGPSEVIDPRTYGWRDGGWRGRPWEEAVLYELHVGAFTHEGTFRSATERLDHLADLGVTAIELMAIADFAGLRNWGYDGVLLYAPDSAYGRPEDVKAFVDAAHERGILVILDVVYNHFGPEGNYLPRYLPQLLTDKHCTPWGQALNFDGDGSAPVRELIIHNALYWIEEFHMDGLRLDAAHAMIDSGPRHILDELADRVHAAAGERIVHLILEHEHNIAAKLARNDQGAAKLYTAQWNHDITHLLGATMAKRCADRDGDEGGETEKLGKALAEGFVIAAQDGASPPPSERVPPTAFAAFLQTHDLVGNRIGGERIHALAPEAAVRAAAAVYLLLPQVPMLFMGEEWGASTPFPFFCDYHGELAEAVRKGRCDQLASQEPKPDAEALRNAPDPQAEETFRSAQMRWEEIGEAPHAASLELYRALLQVRREQVVPLLRGLTETCGTFRVVAPGALAVRWELAGGAVLQLAANLCDEPRSGFDEATGQTIWPKSDSAGGVELEPWGVRWTITSKRQP